MEKSIEFYKTLGFELLYTTKEWSELSYKNTIELALRKADEKNNSGSAGIGFQVENCEEITKNLESLGITIRTRCEKKNDIILTRIKDFDGNIVWFSEKRK